MRIYGAVADDAKPEDVVGRTINYMTLGGNMGVGVVIHGWATDGFWLVRNNDSEYRLNPDRMVATYVYHETRRSCVLHEGDRAPFRLAFKAGS